MVLEYVSVFVLTSAHCASLIVSFGSVVVICDSADGR